MRSNAEEAAGYSLLAARSGVSLNRRLR